jgi:CBS domain-containing protein
MYCIRFHRYAPTTHQETTCTPLGCCGRRGLYTSIAWVHSFMINPTLQEEERKGGKKGRLLGIITLSDVLRYVIGPVDIQESVEPPEEPPSGLATPTSATTITEA